MIFLTFGISFGILGYRGVQLHTKQDHKIQKLAKRQYTERVRPLPLRGNIYDRRGQELAVSVPVYSLAVHPNLVSDIRTLARRLSQVLTIKEKDIRKKLTTERKFVWIKRRLMPEELEQIKHISDASLSLQKEARRYYPNREVASQLLGAVGYDGEGLGGLELQYDKLLQGPEAREIAYRDARGDVYASSDDLTESDGAFQLHLTLDRNIQYVAETELTAAAHRLKLSKGSIIVMDTQTGAVIAMASYPRFNPNNYSEYGFDKWRNVGVTDSIEPGSVFKAITVAAALESGKYEIDSQIFCENGRLQIGNTIIKDHEKYGDLNFGEILKYSSNIGAAKMAASIGKTKLFKMIERFGFGQTTDIDFPGEAKGSIRNPDAWHPVDLAAISFGQGLMATPLQITNAYATIANRGKRMKPYLVQRITRADGELIRETEPKSLGLVIRPETAERLVRLLEGVTQKGGTGTAASIPGYRIAGKTGTAQKYDNKKKAYSNTDYYSSFIGFGPTDEPRLVIFVGLDGPQGDQIYGGQIAAPIFRKVMSAALYQFKLPPTQRTLPLDEITVADNDSLLKVIESKKANTNSSANNGHRIIPDFTGLSIRQSMTLVEGRNFRIDIEGTGVAYRQEPAPGRVLKSGEVCRVHFKPAS